MKNISRIEIDMKTFVFKKSFLTFKNSIWKWQPLLLSQRSLLTVTEFETTDKNNFLDTTIELKKCLQFKLVNFEYPLGDFQGRSAENGSFPVPPFQNTGFYVCFTCYYG